MCCWGNQSNIYIQSVLLQNISAEVFHKFLQKITVGSDDVSPVFNLFDAFWMYSSVQLFSPDVITSSHCPHDKTDVRSEEACKLKQMPKAKHLFKL